MIDIALIRKDPEKVRAGIKSRGGRYLSEFEELVSLDSDHRRILKQVEVLRAEMNLHSKEIGKAKAAKDETAAKARLAEVAKVKEKLAAAEKGLPGTAAKLRLASLSLPNLPHASCPPGEDEKDNRVVREGLAPPAKGFQALGHKTLGERLRILDFAAAAKLSGSRFALWSGEGARLMRALINFQLDLHLKAGYREVWPPYLVRPEILEGTGQLPKFETDLYKTTTSEGEKSHEHYLIPTAEVPLTNLAREEIVPAERLPIKLTAYTPCFRQEAGSYGKDVHGLIRNHQFDKVELVWITRPEDSLAALETLTADAESVLSALQIPHRVIELCTADLGFASRKTYDLEVWMPSEGRYREISSCSDCGDFQARRMSARFRRGPKDPPEFVHTLNGSGVAVGRLFAAVLENFQGPDGSVAVPRRLVPYFGADRISAAG